MRKINIEQEQNKVKQRGYLPMIYTKQEIEELYNNFFKGLCCLEIIPEKTEENMLRYVELKKEGKKYKQKEIVTIIDFIEEEDENKKDSYEVMLSFLTLFEVETLDNYGILLPEEKEAFENPAGDILLPSPTIDSNYVIDKLLRNISKEMGRYPYHRDKETSGIESFFRYVFDSGKIELIGVSEDVYLIGKDEEGYDEKEHEDLILFAFPLDTEVF